MDSTFDFLKVYDELFAVSESDNLCRIHEEYVRIFGMYKRDSLFEPNDEEYLGLRESIINAPKELFSKSSLPFEQIIVIPYEDWKYQEKIDCSLAAIKISIDTIFYEIQKYQEKVRGLLDFLEGLREYKISKLPIFYIKKASTPSRSCDAMGYYDETKSEFVLLKGSLLSLDMVLSYQYSSAGLFRKNIIEPLCMVEQNGYRLTCDYSFASPSSAASAVLGRAASGWQEWQNEKHETLRAIYKDKR